MPAIVASAPDAGRVLWVAGFFDLERSAYTGSKSLLRARALAISWVAWLAGDVP